MAEVVEEAYAAMARRHPDVRFVYGETGLAEGGPFKPHRTHQNGLAVDFFVPVRNRESESVPLPTHVLNKWGYDVELDGKLRFSTRPAWVRHDEHYHVDFAVPCQPLR